jgi:hypothetical protein
LGSRGASAPRRALGPAGAQPNRKGKNVFHSQDFDLERSLEVGLPADESAAPKWFGFVIGGVALFYLMSGWLLVAYLG